MTAWSTEPMPLVRWRGRPDVGWWPHGTTAVLVIAAAIVVFRTLVYLRFEQLAFDSDQAVVGLMAKHLMEGRAFPLFYYGLTYLLGVEAWIAVPFFFLAGPTVLALRLSMLAWNLAFAVLVIVGLQRAAGLRPWPAITPALFFLIAPASVSRQLVAAQGGNIEPFVYVGVLWFLRRHPLWFGAMLALGARNREFTLYAVPVLLALELLTGEMNRARVRDWMTSAVMFFAVWESIEALKPFADFGGPGTRGQLLGGFSGSQISNLAAQFNWQSGALGERVGQMGIELTAWLTGAIQIDSNLPIRPQSWLLWAGGLALVLAAGRLVWLLIRPDGAEEFDRPRFRSHLQAAALRVARTRFAFYILGVGLVAIAAFIAGKPGLQGYSRYVLLGLLVPVGLTAALLRLEPRRILRHLTTVVVVGWGALMAVDHATILLRYARDPPSNPAREIAERLVARRIRVASAGYWEAYAISFIAGERVRVASSDVERIQEYQKLFFDPSNRPVLISERPCPGGERVSRWYICGP
ncbi:MAG: hypothetical protein ABJA98_16500 [Acidobacteriota bacterium]